MQPPADGPHTPSFLSPDRLPFDDIRNAEILFEFMRVHMISKRVSALLLIPHTIRKLTLLS